MWKNKKDAVDLVKRMLTSKTRRITAAAAMAHPWVVKYIATDTRLTAPVSPVVFRSLVDFQKIDKLKQAVLLRIASQISEGEIEPIRRAFLAMDTNHDGKLSKEEMLAGLKSSMSQASILELIHKIDVDKSGYIDYQGTRLRASL